MKRKAMEVERGRWSAKAKREVVLDASQKLLNGGESLRDVLEAFAKLLTHP